jgi:hypothetical protein
MKNRLFWIIIIVTLVFVILAGVYYIFYQKNQMKDLVLQSEINKELLEDEFNDLSTQYQEHKLTISNDSLIAKLNSEQMRVQRLQEELRTVKSTNTKRINELTKELETLRTILRGYVQQIDSLNRLNQQLEQKNQLVTAQYKQATQTVSQLSKTLEEKEQTVQMASKLTTGNITVTGITSKNKPTTKIKDMDQIEVYFVINGNIIAEPGEKTVYIRIQKPDDNILLKSRSNVFVYENKEINYSEKRTIEYTGDEQSLSIYWKTEDYFLVPGTYRVDIFADGNRIGQKSFKLDK